MIIEIPSTGEQMDAYIVADEPAAPLAVRFGPAGRARYTLAPMLNVGWRIVESTPAERAPSCGVFDSHCQPKLIDVEKPDSYRFLARARIDCHVRAPRHRDQPFHAIVITCCTAS